ncbi:disrupted in schizophrenia 1 protein [Chanos chanos]|uniref:Disrupted in schizophrenia 1 protein n=1 Tax=Chanos chanos TaxID=29144 RepID=A0A6J2V8I0_CHACN|nr:disrupted in schizophrenia 1 protein [Chanos chanos]
MFAGMIRLESTSAINIDSEPQCHRWAKLEGGFGTAGEGGVNHRRSQRRLECVRPELSRQTDSSLGKAKRDLCLSSALSGAETSQACAGLNSFESSPKPPNGLSISWHQDLVKKDKLDPSQQRPELLSVGLQVPTLITPETLKSCFSPSGQSGKSQEIRLAEESWKVDLDMPWNSQDKETSTSVTSDLQDIIPDSDSGSLDTEVTSSLSVDSSDTASASSATSGYESATPSSDHAWDGLLKKYEGVLQNCLQSNRTNTKIESMMLKLQRLQQKAVLDDDYDTAERFGKKLEELRKERASLKPGLPSRHPSVCGFLERLQTAVHTALQRTDGECRENGESSACEEGSACTRPMQRREQLLQEKQQVQAEIQELQLRLTELQERSRALEQLIAQEDQQLEMEEVEGPVLRACSTAQLRQMGRAVEDLVTSPHRAQICVSPPPIILRLQEQDQALSLAIKEATAKVVMSQRLGSSVRRKVSESESQLLALHEAKLAAISGNDFGSAKELKAEMRAVYGERDRLEGLARRLQSLSTGSSQDLAQMKEQHSQVKQELEQRETQYEQNLKENTLKYIELLEDRLHSCGSPALERIWEADLEACHLLLRSLRLRTPSCCGQDSEDLPPTPEPRPMAQPYDKEEADCAMLTALGGRWCPEANLQHSEFTKKLEEFLFCLEDNHPEDVCVDAVELTEQCEMISDRLLNLEDQLQMAILNQDHNLTLCLEKEVQEVKATLQTMLSQLKEEDEDQKKEDEEEEQYHDTEEGAEQELEEDLYFSDSWEI